MGISILAVDDSRTARDMVRLSLSSAGMTVTLANDGIEGLEALESLAPDAILVDIYMPRLDGFGFIEAVRKIERLRGVPILVVTSEYSPELKSRARNAGATGWISKPFDPQKLIKTINVVTR